jgi:hypothetical protein
MEFENSLPFSQELIPGSYPESDECNAYSYPTSLRSILILSFHLRTELPSGFFFSGFQPKPCTHSSSIPCMLHALPI